MKALYVTEPAAFCIFQLKLPIITLDFPAEHFGNTVICTTNHVSLLTDHAYQQFRESLPIGVGPALPARFDHFRPCMRPGMALGTVSVLRSSVEPGLQWNDDTGQRDHFWALENAHSFPRPFRVRQPESRFCEMDDAQITAALLGAPASPPARERISS